MLTYVMLRALERAMRGERVLSVYLDGGATDTGSRGAWRAGMDGAIAAIDHRLPAGDTEERHRFQRAVENVRKLLPRVATGALGTPGWIAFATADECVHVEATPSRLQPGVWWEDGLHVAPYLRGLRANHNALAVIVDGRSARVYRCRAGEVHVIDRVHAHADGALYEERAPSHGYFAPPGPTLDVPTRAARERMLSQLAERLRDAIAADEWLVIGGAPIAARAAVEHVPSTLSDRLVFASGLHRSATDHELQRATQEAIDEVMCARENGDLRALFDGTDVAAAARLGYLAVVAGLADGSVRRVLLSEAFVGERPDEAEAVVRAAFDAGVHAEVLEPPASLVADAAAAGIVGLLHCDRFGVARARAALKPLAAAEPATV